MIHEVAVRLTNYCIGQKWINAAHQDWCIYAFEKKLLSIVFFLLLLFCSIISRKPVEIATFSLTFLFLRRRMGGWHAKHTWSCQLLSVMCVLFAVFILGPLALQFPNKLNILIDVAIMLWAIILQPIYPPQLHFEPQEEMENCIRKNHIIAGVALFQIISLVCGLPKLFIYSILGVLAGIISVYIEKLKQSKEGFYHENNG